MSKTRKIIFYYFDTYCYGELTNDGLQKYWLEPIGKGETFAYHTIKETIFYGDSFYNEVSLMFNTTKKEFENFFKEWFYEHYSLPVLNIF